MRVDHPDPKRWSPTGDPDADRDRLGLIHADAIRHDCNFTHGAFVHNSQCQYAPVAVPQADGDDGEGWDLLLDYDRDHDVPGHLGAVLDARAWTELGQPIRPIRCVEIHDGPPDPKKARHILARRLERSGHTITGWEWSRSTNGWHVKLRIEPRPKGPIETVALQAILGSDPLRESCNLQRAREVEVVAEIAGGDAAKFWRERWNVLYRPNPNRQKVKP